MKNLNEKKEKNWIFKSDDDQAATASIRQIASELGISPIIAKLLYRRGYTTVQTAKSFIYMESEMISNPFKMKDMEKGVERIKRAVECGEGIAVYGDYDVDGVTAVCTLYLYLESLGAKVEYYIPNRAGEGYGVSGSAIDSLKESGVSLIITVDTGITANEEVEYARSLGIDFIVTDHHECRGELPVAVAVINPHRPDCDYPFKELAGVGVVFKLICAYEESVLGKSRREATENIFKRYSDLVAIGTIADVMPIKDENRIIVKYGLDMIENTSRLGISSLIDAASARPEGQRSSSRKKKSKITSGYIGYTLAPRINAAGRIKSASVAVELFLSKEQETAKRIAEELCRTNKERQAEENKIMQEAYEKIERLGLENDPVIVLEADTWHHGVIGIVSSRITEKYGRPSILVSFEGNDNADPKPSDVGKGSGRSVKGMNLVDALCYSSEHLVKFGGHELAAGLSVTRGELPAFIKMINDYARENLSSEDMTPSIEADCEIEFENATLSLARGIQMLEPYGVGNPMPVFVMSGVFVNEITPISDGKHTKLILGNGKYTLSCMYFSASPDSLGIYVGDTVDILFNIDINEWGGRESVQLIVRDLKLSKKEKETYKAEAERFEEIRRGASFSRDEDILPSRDDFAAVYKLMFSSLRLGQDTLSHRDILSRFRCEGGASIGYAKLKVIIMVFKELNIMSIEERDDEVYKFHTKYHSTKADLEKSNILRRLRSAMQKNL